MIKISTIKLLFISSFLFLCDPFSNGQQLAGVYEARINTLHQNIYQHFYDSLGSLFYEKNPVQPGENSHSYLWPLCALIQAANEEETLWSSKDFMAPVMKAIDQYQSNIAPAPAYQAYVAREKKDSRFYDDNQWIAIACLDAYTRTKKKMYFNIADEIYRFMMTGFDTLSGGGLYWKEDEKSSKNTCSNGPGIIVALQLYKVTNQKHYLDTALLLYNWVNKNLQAPEGVYYDNIKIPSLKIGRAFYTYNAGTMLQSNVLLYSITKNKKYLKEAERIATAAKNIFYRDKKLPGNYWFNAVLLRGEIALYKVDKDKKHIQFFIDDADRIWRDEKDTNGFVGTNKTKSLIDQAAMIEIYARLAELNNN